MILRRRPMRERTEPKTHVSIGALKRRRRAFTAQTTARASHPVPKESTVRRWREYALESRPKTLNSTRATGRGRNADRISELRAECRCPPLPLSSYHVLRSLEDHRDRSSSL